MRVLHRTQAVGDYDDGAVFHQIVYGFLHHFFGLVIQRAGGFVQNDHGGIFYKSARNGQTLFLPAGEKNPAFPNFRIQLFGQAAHKLVQAGAL